MRWVMRLQEFDLDIRHRKGRKSGNVDSLTRDPALGERPYGEAEIEPLYDQMLQNFETKHKIMMVLAAESDSKHDSEGDEEEAKSSKKEKPAEEKKEPTSEERLTAGRSA